MVPGSGGRRNEIWAARDPKLEAACEVRARRRAERREAARRSSTSQRNAERRGFRIAYTRSKWRLAATTSPPIIVIDDVALTPE